MSPQTPATDPADGESERPNATSCVPSATTWLPKNLSIYWIVNSTIAVWFLFHHSPPQLIESQAWRDVPFLFHLIGAYVIYMSCMINTLLTPSTLNGKAKPFHVWIGRVGLLLGAVSFCLGLYVTWWPLRENLPDRGFAIGISIGGCFQVLWEYRGYRAIKKYQSLKLQIELEQTMEEPLLNNHEEQDNQNTVTSTTSLTRTTSQLEDLHSEKDKALEQHIGNMIGVFVVGCGAPAVVRVVFLFGATGVVALVATVVIMVSLIRPFANFYTCKLPKRCGTPATNESSLLTEPIYDSLN